MKRKTVSRIFGAISVAALFLAIGTVGLADMGELHFVRLIGSVIVFILAEAVWLITREDDDDTE